MNVQTDMGREQASRKIVSISQKRQITIPKKYFSQLGFGSEAECFMRGNELVIRPVAPGGDELSEQILADLVSHGYGGQELLMKFHDARRQIRPAVEVLLEEAGKAAQGETAYETFDDIFGGED